MLVTAGACDKAIARFRRTFGDSVVVTEDAALEVALFFDWDCAATKLLSPSQQEVYEDVIDVGLEENMSLLAYQRLAATAWVRAYEAV